MNKVIKILDSLKIGKKNITTSDIAILTDNEIDEINKCYVKKYTKSQYFIILCCLDLKRERIVISRFIMDYMKPDEYVYVYVQDEEFKTTKVKIKDIIYNRWYGNMYYVKRMNKFQKWLKNDG